MTFRPPRGIPRLLRQRATPTERHVWGLVRGRRILGLKFRRQHRIDRFVVDFYCAELKLVLEVEGPVHTTRRDYDEARAAWLRSQGYRVVRIPNALVSEDTIRSIIVEATGSG